MEYKYKYDRWLLKELKEAHEGFLVCSVPVVGWSMAILMFSFIFPIIYIFRSYKTRGQRIRILESRFANLKELNNANLKAKDLQEVNNG